MTTAAETFKDQHLSAANAFRSFPGTPMMLIGQAALVLLKCNEPVTLEAIRDCVTTLDDERDADMISRTLELIDQSDHRQG